MSRRHVLFRAAAAILLAGGVFTKCRESQAPQQSATAPPPLQASATLAPSVTLVGAGTVASCSSTGDEATAAILDTIPGTVFTVGDNVYPSGSLANYQGCYNSSWGRHSARTRPALGNHEYDTSPTAGDYFTYFGATAGDATKGYYSYDLGAWHIVALNSVASTGAGSPQEQWLRADLAAHPQHCTLAYWHYPRFSSGSTHGSMPQTQPLWQALYDAGADIVLSGHEHNYERFAPQTPGGALDQTRGIREFVVGTGGGAAAYAFGTPIANSEVRITGVNGVLRLTLGDGTYTWQFIPVAGKTATDAGSGTCHNSTAPLPPPPPPPPPPTPSVNGGPDLTTHPGDALQLAVGFSDAGANAAPWAYTITWGDGSSSNGTVSSATTPITASHVYSGLGLDSVRVTVTNNLARSGADSLAVQVIALGGVVLVGAGDIADCTRNGDSLTANLLDTIPGTVFLAGDNAYPGGSSTDYANCYDPTWGRHKARTRPVPGNHEYSTAGAAGYFGYFGATAGDPAKGYYSYDLGDWHIVALNSNIAKSAGSPQEQWLRADLAASTKRCTLAYMHHPLFSSGTLADATTQPLWQALYDAGAELVLAGHDHNYQRFRPQTPTGVADPITGIREFIAGMGGAGTFTLGAPLANTEVQNDQTYGVLKLTLYATGYDWKFIPVAGKTFTDAGSGICHDAIGAVNHLPTAAAGGPYSGSEGAAASFDASGSSDPDGDALSYAWDFGDGSTGTGVKPSHSYADNGTYTVALTVTDARGATSAPTTTTATIANVPPAVNAGANQTITLGGSFTLTAGFGDQGVNDTPWAYAIDWGDGSPQTTGSTTSQSNPITASHTYAAAGTNTVRISVTDKDGAAGSGQVTATVTATVNHPPVAGPAGPYSGSEGTAVAFDGGGSTDPDGDALTYSWSFGDGSSGTGIKPSHAYADNGTYGVTLTVTDARGAPSGPVTTTATIANAGPTVNAGVNQTATAGSAFALSTNFSDPGVKDAPWAYSIDWGDGSPATTGSVTSQSNPIGAAHTYAAAGTNVLRATVTDKDGAAGAGSKVVTVSSVPAAVTLVGAGNIARCDRTGDEATAALLDAIPGTVFTLGDNARLYGTPANYTSCYDPSWGRHKSRTRPSLGNHEYDSSATAVGHFNYFGAAAGPPGLGYYSYDLGAWHIIVLNSSNPFVATAAGSPQELWLKADLAATAKRCVLAMWHNPRFYSTTSAAFYPTTSVKPFWDDLYAARAELIINAHMRDYERFAPQTPGGVADPVNGIREIIVGTGGEGFDLPNTLIIPNSEAQISYVSGVLQLTLADGSYSWQFIPVAGQTATDSGSGTCH